WAGYSHQPRCFDARDPSLAWRPSLGCSRLLAPAPLAPTGPCSPGAASSTPSCNPPVCFSVLACYFFALRLYPFHVPLIEKAMLCLAETQALGPVVIPQEHFCHPPPAWRLSCGL